MKKLFLISGILFLFSYNLFSQWHVQGGNIIWPYGDVTISQGNLTLNSGTLDVTYSTIDSLKLNDNIIVNSDMNHSRDIDLGFGDNDTGFGESNDDDVLNMWVQNVKVFTGTNDEFKVMAHFRLSGTSYSIADVSNPPTDAQLDAIWSSPDDVSAGFIGILNDAGAGLNFYFIGSDGTNWWISIPQKAL